MKKNKKENTKNKKISELHYIFTVHLCIIDYFYQQMHQDKFVTVFFIERVPQYAFRQLYCHHQGVF